MQVDVNVSREAGVAIRSIQRILEAENLKRYFKHEDFPFDYVISYEDLEKTLNILNALKVTKNV